MNPPVIARPLSSYQPQLDGLRALAILGVLVHHFKGPFHELTNFGALGVRYFFVLSAFLATRSLLKTQTKMGEGKSSAFAEFWIFEKRRFIRILPAYYLFLAIAAAFNLPPVRETLAWTIPFLTNFQMIVTNEWPLATSHFWYLAVQEQCYLIWPWLIFCLPKSWLRPALASLVVLALAFRLWCVFSGASDLTRWFHPLANIDSFAIGGLLAWWSLTNPGLISKTSTRLWSGLLAVVAVYLGHRLRFVPMANPLTALIDLLNALFMAWLIACSVAGFRGLPGRFLSCTPLVWLGKISYGVYVYHVLVSMLGDRLMRSLGLTWGDGTQIRFLLLTSITIFIAWLSWRFFETPILRLRER